MRGGVGGGRGFSRLESPQKPLTGLQSYDSEEGQLVCVCSSVRLNPDPAWMRGLATEVQSPRFRAVVAPGCQRYCCSWRCAFSSTFVLLHRRSQGWSDDETYHLFPRVSQRY